MIPHSYFYDNHEQSYDVLIVSGTVFPEASDVGGHWSGGITDFVLVQAALG